MKLIIQIPCFNEAESLPTTLASLPRVVPGFDSVEFLVVDDGSWDKTSEVARCCGAQHVVRHHHNRGLAQAFMTGLDSCLLLGADVIVNTDADNQYNAHDIPKLVEPILARRAEFVVGARPINSIKHFSHLKRCLQQIGSWVVRVVSNAKVLDAPSGFRAFSRSAAQRLMVFSDYTYTLETIIQAGQKNMAVSSVPVRVNPDLRPSRLVKTTSDYVCRSVATIFRIFVIYRPFRFFALIGSFLFVVGAALGVRFLYFYLSGDGSGKIQSLILAAVLLTMGFQTLLVAFIADILAANRKLIEDVRYKLALLSEREHRNQTKRATDG